MNNQINNLSFEDKKNNMQRSTVIIAVLVGIIILLSITIIYLMGRNLTKCDVKDTPKIEYKEKIIEKKVEEKVDFITIDENLIEELNKVIPRITNTQNYNYNLFTSEGIERSEIKKLDNKYEELNYKEVYHELVSLETDTKDINLYMRILLYDKYDGVYIGAIDKLNYIRIDPNDPNFVKNAGHLYKLTFKKDQMGYYLSSVEYKQ